MKNLLIILLLSIAATTATAASDSHSYAQPDKFLVRHVSLDLTAFSFTSLPSSQRVLVK